MKCRNCGKEKGDHYIGVTSDRKQMFKNTILWCYPISKEIKPDDKRYFMKFLDVGEGVA
jgi:hypothetical protein